tara:strand:- start:31 stop:1230 length:1200 start_codon:yes stop_codon:yes gene_type:complete
MKQLNNINTIWGQVDQPKTSNDKITYYGDYHTFEDIDTNQFTDEVLVWYKPEFSKEEWRYGLYGIKNLQDSNCVEEKGVITIELQNKYVYLQCKSGFNDILCRISNALDYCNKYNRILLLDGINSVYKINFSEYFSYPNIITDYNIIKIIFNKNYSIYPSILKSKINYILDGTLQFNEYTWDKKQIFIYNNISLYLPDNDVEETIVIYVDSGGGKHGFNIFKDLRFKPILKEHCLENYHKLPKPYLALQIRYTDRNCDYEQLYNDNVQLIHSYKAIYIATDNIDILQFFKAKNLNIYNFTTFPKNKTNNIADTLKIYSEYKNKKYNLNINKLTTFPDIIFENLHENEEISGDIKIKNLICDLYIMAMSDMLLSNSKGGFIHLARDCFNNKDLIKDKFII